MEAEILELARQLAETAGVYQSWGLPVPWEKIASQLVNHASLVCQLYEVPVATEPQMYSEAATVLDPWAR